VTLVQERRLAPPRVARFCPAKHCARACGPADCACRPCRCETCRRRAARAGKRALTPDILPALKAAQPHLFSERTLTR
jgi:hypothetical protein